jgi:hypothetical protein
MRQRSQTSHTQKWRTNQQSETFKVIGKPQPRQNWCGAAPFAATRTAFLQTCASFTSVHARTNRELLEVHSLWIGWVCEGVWRKKEGCLWSRHGRWHLTDHHHRLPTAISGLLCHYRASDSIAPDRDEEGVVRYPCGREGLAIPPAVKERLGKHGNRVSEVCASVRAFCGAARRRVST